MEAHSIMDLGAEFCIVKLIQLFVNTTEHPVILVQTGCDIGMGESLCLFLFFGFVLSNLTYIVDE